MKARQPGFTLIELMITLAIAVILITLAVPNLRAFILNNRITTQANSLLADLGFARSEAAKLGLRVVLCTSSDQATCTGDSDWGVGRIVWADLDADGTVGDAASGEVLRVAEPQAAGNTLVSFASADRVIYRPNGVSDSQRSFKVCDDRAGDYGRTLTITATGRAGVEKDPATCP